MNKMNNELQDLWERDLIDIKDKVPNWQKDRIKLIPFNTPWYLKFLSCYSHVCVVSCLVYKIYVPNYLQNMDSNFRKICLAHEYGHVVNNHCLKYCFLYYSGLLCFFIYFLLVLVSMPYYGAIIGLIGFCCMALALLYDAKYKKHKKEFKADDVAIKVTNEEEVLLWLKNLLLRNNVSEESKETLRKRIERLEVKIEKKRGNSKNIKEN